MQVLEKTVGSLATRQLTLQDCGICQNTVILIMKTNVTMTKDVGHKVIKSSNFFCQNNVLS